MLISQKDGFIFFVKAYISCSSTAYCICINLFFILIFSGEKVPFNPEKKLTTEKEMWDEVADDDLMNIEI